MSIMRSRLLLSYTVFVVASCLFFHADADLHVVAFRTIQWVQVPVDNLEGNPYIFFLVCPHLKYVLGGTLAAGAWPLINSHLDATLQLSPARLIAFFCKALSSLVLKLTCIKYDRDCALVVCASFINWILLYTWWPPCMYKLYSNRVLFSSPSACLVVTYISRSTYFE